MWEKSMKKFFWLIQLQPTRRRSENSATATQSSRDNIDWRLGECKNHPSWVGIGLHHGQQLPN